MYVIYFGGDFPRAHVIENAADKFHMKMSSLRLSIIRKNLYNKRIQPHKIQLKIDGEQ